MLKQFNATEKTQKRMTDLNIQIYQPLEEIDQQTYELLLVPYAV